MKESVPGQPELKFIAIGDLRPSKFNHRKTIKEAELADLTDSIRINGVLQPLSVRPVTKKGSIEFYEIGSGERRFRGAERAGLDFVPCIVREQDDKQFVTLVNVENLQRADVHPLEEAEGYVDMMQVVGADVVKLAQVVGKHEGYIRDRLQLLKLTPAAKQMFRDDRFTLGHAIELSRQTRELQEQIIKVPAEEYDRAGPLWDRADESGLFAAQDEAAREQDPFFGLSLITVKELKSWINQHVRFDPNAETVPTLFPKTAEVLKDATDMKLKTIAITYSRRVEPEIKGGRIYGPDDWRRADGTEGAPLCNSSDVGLVVGGPHRGEAFAVCTDKKHCDTHWAEEIKAAEKADLDLAKSALAPAAKDRADGVDPKKAAKEQKRRDKEYAEQAKAQAEMKRTSRIQDFARPHLLAAMNTAITKSKSSDCGAKGRVGKLVLDDILKNGEIGFSAVDTRRMPKAGKAEDMIRMFAFKIVDAYDDAHSQRVYAAKALGVNIAKIMKDASAFIAKEDKAAAAAAEKKAK